jgi:predicted nucleotidyltransferase
MQNANFEDLTPKMIDKTLSDLCAEYPGIIAAWLFGSAATETMKEESDIDLAVIVAPQESDAFPQLSFSVEAEKACGRRVDVVILNRAGDFLQYEVRRSGRLLFERDASHRKQFEISGRKRFEDFLYLHRRYTQKVLYGERHG